MTSSTPAGHGVVWVTDVVATAYQRDVSSNGITNIWL